MHGNDGVIGDIIHPIERGIIKDWDAMEDLWRYTFYTGLGWEPGNEGQLLVAEPLLTPKVCFSLVRCDYLVSQIFCAELVLD